MTQSNLEIIKADCPNCGKGRRAEVHGHVPVTWEHESGCIWSRDDNRLLRCLGCETVYFQKEHTFSENEQIVEDPMTGQPQRVIPSSYTYWPSAPSRQEPGWGKELGAKDQRLRDLLDSVYVAYQHELNVLAAIGIRTTFDRATELIGIEPTTPFAEKLKELEERGHIGTNQRSALTILTDAGSAAAHRGWKPTLKQLDTMILTIEGFLHDVFILNDAAHELKTHVPAKAKK